MFALSLSVRQKPSLRSILFNANWNHIKLWIENNMIFYKVQTILCLYSHKLTAATLFYLFINSFFFFFFFYCIAVLLSDHMLDYIICYGKICVYTLHLQVLLLYIVAERMCQVYRESEKENQPGKHPSAITRHSLQPWCSTSNLSRPLPPLDFSVTIFLVPPLQELSSQKTTKTKLIRRRTMDCV